jgi:glycerol uptake facilitator-like aquaporin
MPPFVLGKRLCAEFLGTALLLAIVVGSGIMGDRLAGGNVAVALLGNSLATGAGLVVLILILGPVSGCHINPAVTLSFMMQGQIDRRDAALYVVMQVVGAVAGVMAAHLMFDLPVVVPGIKIRSGVGQWLGEGIATFGLMLTIMGCLRFRARAVPYAVGLYITAGYWFTSSTSFANPAVTLARALTDTFTGIRPADAPMFIAAQIAGAVFATSIALWLFAGAPEHEPERRRYPAFPWETPTARDAWRAGWFPTIA